MKSTFDMWNEKWSELMDEDGVEPAKAAHLANEHVRRDLIEKAKKAKKAKS